MRVTFYTRLGCHLCDDARRALDTTGVAYHVVDVDDDRDMQKRYGQRVPVVEVDGVSVAEGNMSDVPLARILERML